MKCDEIKDLMLDVAAGAGEPTPALTKATIVHRAQGARAETGVLAPQLLGKPDVSSTRPSARIVIASKPSSLRVKAGPRSPIANAAVA